MSIKRISVVSFALLLVLILTLPLVGCGKEAPAVGTEEKNAVSESAPIEEEVNEIHFGSLSVSPNVENLDLSNSGAALEELMVASNKLPNIKKITLGVTGATLEQLRAIEKAFPQAEVSWSAKVLDQEIECHTQNLEIGAATDSDIEQILSALAILPEIKTITLAPDGGVTALSFENLRLLSNATPDAELNCRFELFGQTADWTTERLKYFQTDVGNEGIEVFQSVLPYLRSLTLLRLENCGITDNDRMASLRSDFPDKRIVWSINIAGYTYMTDTTLINDGDTHLLNDENVQLFRYMPEVLYLDIGHNKALTNIEFVRNFPKLQVVILTLTNIADLSPLENCSDLEFLECHSTKIGDLSALADKEKLEYLNIANLPNISDLSPLYGLTNLKIVRICGTTFTHISKDDVAALKAALPDTFVSDYGGDPNNSGHWRYDDNWNPTERYALLRQQMLYDLNWQLRLSNSPSGEES